METRATPAADPLRLFGERVREAREARGLSQSAFAKRQGFNRTYVSSVECGRRNLGLLNVLRLAQALEVDAGQLLDGLPPPPGLVAGDVD